MTERITPPQFHEADGVEDWQVVTDVACGHFRTGSFATGIELVDVIGKLADAANHHPDVDLRSESVTVRLTTTTPDHYFWLSERDVELARQISAAARELGVLADPTAVQMVHVTIDALVHPKVLPFWRAVLGYRQVGDEDLLDPHYQGPSFWFQEMLRRARSATASTSTCGCRTTRPRHVSRRRSPPAATWSATSTLPHGGPWPTPRATRSTWPRGWVETEPHVPLQRSMGVIERFRRAGSCPAQEKE